jgi:hypothetical protein
MSDESATDPIADQDADPAAIAGWHTVGIFPTEEEARFVVDYLRSGDLAAELESMIVHELPVSTGGMGGVRVRVPDVEADAADRMLAARGDVALAEGESMDGTEQAADPASGDDAAS